MWKILWNVSKIFCGISWYKNLPKSISEPKEKQTIHSLVKKTSKFFNKAKYERTLKLGLQRQDSDDPTFSTDKASLFIKGLSNNAFADMFNLLKFIKVMKSYEAKLEN